jgi:hypothetical protein
MGTTPINDAYREALGFPRREACALVAVVSAWMALGRGVSPAEVDRFVEQTDESGIAYASKALPRLERLGLLTSPAKPGTNRRPYQPTPRGLRMVLGWAGRKAAA